MRLASDNKLFLNTEQEDWSSLASRLSQIYSGRVDRTLYLLADDDVRFHSVAYALDLVKNVGVTRNSDQVGIGAGNLHIGCV